MNTTLMHAACGAVLLSALFLPAAATAAAATPRGYEPDISVERSRREIHFEADGSYRESIEVARRVRTAQGVKRRGSYVLSYVSSQQEITRVEAETVTPDGTKIPVPAEAIRDREEDNSGGASEFSDAKERVVIYPRVEVGSLLVARWEIRGHTPPYPGEYSRAYVFPVTFASEDWEAVITTPAGRPLYLEMRGVTGGLERTAGGRAIYRFRYRQPEARAPERDAADPMHYGSYLFASSMPDMLAIGRISRSYYAPKVELTPEIRALAERLVAGAPDERARVRALYEWVVRNIRYVAVSLGNGRLVPNPASSVLRNRYGDCKDHVVLLESLLAAVGIASSPALVSTGAAHRFAGIGVHRPIDHVITYVPSLDLYLDATDSYSAFGELSTSVADKPVVLTALGRLGRTPAPKAADHLSRSHARMAIGEDGVITGSVRAEMTGLHAQYSRGQRFSRQSSTEADDVKGILQRFNETGSGSIRSADPADIAQPYWEESRFTLEPRANFPGRGAITIPVGLGPGDIAATAVTNPDPERTTPYQCTSYEVEEHTEIEFPANVVIDAIPEDVRFERGGIRYVARYAHDGRRVTVQRALRAQFASMLCGEAEHRDWVALRAVLQRDLRSQVVYR